MIVDVRRTIAGQIELKAETGPPPPPPQITVVSVTPDHGATTEATACTLTCTNVDPTATYTVSCAGVSCTSVVAVNATTITFVTANGMATDDVDASDIVVTDTNHGTGTATLTAAFAVIPHLDSVSPTTWATDDHGVVLTVLGSGFIDSPVTPPFTWIHVGEPVENGVQGEGYTFIDTTNYSAAFTATDGLYDVTLKWFVNNNPYYTNTLEAAITVTP